MQSSVWSIGGFDPSNGAGILADNHVYAKLGVPAQTIITAITAQNGVEVNFCEPVSCTYIEAQVTTLKSCGWPVVIKIGLIPNAQCIEMLHHCLRDFKGTLVYDPVMISSTGSQLMEPDALSLLKTKWLKRISVITPNVFEAQILTDEKIRDPADVPRMARAILSLGVKEVIIKGGHLDGKLAQDYWTDGKDSFWLSTPRIACGKTHGTGCVFSASLAAFAAKGDAMTEAFVQAKMVLSQALRSNLRYQGVHFAKLTDTHLRFENVPSMSFSALTSHNLDSFAPCQSTMGLYPIVEDANWVAKALTWQINSLQLRMKNKSLDALEHNVKQAVAYAKQGSFQLFINDYWQLAIKHQAYGVHLGQEDLNHCDIDSLKNSGIRLGVSTHSYTELARAVALQPSYIAFGPIHATTTKTMRFSPQGTERLTIWRRLVQGQLVAIGGLNLSNIQAAIDCGVDGVCLVSAVTKAPDPQRACQELMAKFNRVLSYE